LFRRIVVGFVHAPANSRPTIYAEEITHKALAEYARNLHTALERVGDGSLRPGPWCKYCPARGVCPTRTSALAELKAPQGIALTAERVGARHQALEIYRDLAHQVDEENRAWITKNGAAVRPDGKLVDFISRHYSNLSQASIVRALGPIKGGEMIDDLKEKGCIEQGERMELRTLNERG
jgi:DNA-binding transcriptional ArsR family regulator